MNKKINIIFESFIELFEELVESKMYEVTQETPIQVFDKRVLVSTSINSDVDLFIVYRPDDLSMVEVYLGNYENGVFYRIEIKPAFYSYQKVPEKYSVCVTNNEIENVLIDVFDSHEDAVLFVNQYQKSNDFYSNADLSIYKLTDFYKGK